MFDVGLATTVDVRSIEFLRLDVKCTRQEDEEAIRWALQTRRQFKTRWRVFVILAYVDKADDNCRLIFNGATKDQLDADKLGLFLHLREDSDFGRRWIESS